MGCRKCADTGWVEEYEEGVGWAELPCPECVGVDGDMPDAIAELHDAAAQADMEAEIEAAWVKRHEELVTLGLELPEMVA